MPDTETLEQTCLLLEEDMLEVCEECCQGKGPAIYPHVQACTASKHNTQIDIDFIAYWKSFNMPRYSHDHISHMMMPI